ncbi:hypothetical protein N658DRAFT_416967 [Parathielavia hyrcaniae]|uniref:C2H2-type domain-containing protein n=1 Tax=Parathielavia hyrcaniae TaxID=113614 RepID=A0AAN6QBS6_9PEZI|nr:hypothetical protein N658DRAFT_416967 [Parathielavia hyrcaniae]
MSSIFNLYPPGPDTTAPRRDQPDQPRNIPPQDPQFLNPFSPQPGSSSASPAWDTNTPADSVSALSIHYQSSEFTEPDDPFFGIDFNTADGASPSFLDESIVSFDGGAPLADNLAVQVPPLPTQHVHQPGPYLPLTPDKSPSLPAGSPNGHTREDETTASGFSNLAGASVAPKDLSLSPDPSSAPVGKHTVSQWTPRTSNDSAESSSDDCLAPVAAMRSPRVTISHWDGDNVGSSHAFHTQDAPSHSDRGFTAAARDGTGRWIPNQVTGQGGLDPLARPVAEVESINDLATQRGVDERKQGVSEWLERSAPLAESTRTHQQPAEVPNDGDDNIPAREIALGNMTENKSVPGQTYYVETGGQPTSEDLALMRQGRNWDDPPLAFSISQPDSAAYQPQTSQAAIERYLRRCRDNDSIVSRTATWGTRRFSLPSMVDNDEVQVAGNLLKKLSINRGEGRRPSILQGLRGLARKASVNSSKRNRPEPDDASSLKTDSSTERKETQAKLAPPSPRPGWSRKQSVPSINTAFVDVGSKAASIGVTHARTGSVSAAPMTSPRSPSGLGLTVKKPLNRLRSKSETSGIVSLLRKAGGPPVSNLGNTKVSVAEVDDDEDEDDDLYEDGDMKSEAATKLIDDITPNFAGFQQHVLKLNPLLSTTNNYLVDRIAYQQCARYKALLSFRVRHLQDIAAKNCSCGSMCLALGGSVNVLDTKGGDPRGLDPLSGSDGDITPLEGAINQDSFPQDIPMPPTTSLPAEFECQLCYGAKKFQKPSDWTKHVHEDVQPFTCTWERCKEPKMFKRKADWVRHENEGHRHLEWWTCDVDDCRHKCYRRDNFLQHLVREHKFVEPKVKTKAAIKRAGGFDPTWAKVEQCHQETTGLPQNEPCRFCGKTFPSWKKLTVHLAKHMEHISLPVLKLVAKKELDEDTIISPVQEPPPRNFPTTFPTQPEQQHPFGPSPTMSQGPMTRQQGHMIYAHHYTPQPLGMYQIPPSQNYATGFYGSNYDDVSMAQTQINMQQQPISHQQHQHHTFQSLNSQATAFPALPVTSAAAAPAYMPTALQASPHVTSPYMSMAQDLEPFPALRMDALGLGLQDPAGAAQMGYLVGGGGGGDGGGGGGGGLDDAANGVVVQVQGHGQVQEQGHSHHHQQHHGQFTPQGSVSPYGHSPNMSAAGGGFYHH